MYKIILNETTKADAYGVARVWGPDAPGGERWVVVAWYATDPYRGPMGGHPIGRQVSRPLSHWTGRDHNGHVWTAYTATETQARRVAQW